MSDLIDRQAAIKLMIDLYEEDCDLYGCAIPECFDCDRATDALRTLPSAQPEVIRCKDCKYSWHPTLRQDQDSLICMIQNKDVEQCGYCSRAERRTDDLG